MTYLYGKEIPEEMQKVLGVKQTGLFDEPTRVAVADQFGSDGKKINYTQTAELEVLYDNAKTNKDEPVLLPGGELDEGSDLDG